MLVLSRKPGEKLLIGEDIVVTVVRIGPNTVRLGIEAPPRLNIVREELVLELGQSLQDPPSSPVPILDPAEPDVSAQDA